MDYEVLLAEKDAIIGAQNVLLERLTLETSSRIQQLEHELAQLKKMIFGSKRERFLAEVNANQLFSKRIGEEITETLEYTRASLVKREQFVRSIPSRMVKVLDW